MRLMVTFCQHRLHLSLTAGLSGDIVGFANLVLVVELAMEENTN
jgi:hypothetical protein